MKYVTFSGSCVNCIMCWSRAIQGNMDADRACADQKIADVIRSTSCIYRICGMQRRVASFTKNRYEASGIDTSSNSGARGWTSFKRNILYAIRSLTINGAEVNRSVFIHAQTARRCRTRRVHSIIHTAAPPDAYRSRPLRTPPDVVWVYRANPTQWTQCVHGQPDAYRSRTVRASGKNCSVPTGLDCIVHHMTATLCRIAIVYKAALYSECEIRTLTLPTLAISWGQVLKVRWRKEGWKSLLWQVYIYKMIYTYNTILSALETITKAVFTPQLWDRNRSGTQPGARVHTCSTASSRSGTSRPPRDVIAVERFRNGSG